MLVAYISIRAHCLFGLCRHHVFSDIMPYVCTFASCPRPGHLYGSRSEWFEHELQTHRREWYCEACSLTFGNKKGIIKHMGDKHKGELPESEFSAVAEWSERVQSSKQACPLCPRNPYPTREHLEQFHSNEIVGSIDFSTTAERLLSEDIPSSPCFLFKAEIGYETMGDAHKEELPESKYPAIAEWSERVQSTKQVCCLCPDEPDITQEHIEQFHSNNINITGGIDFCTTAEWLLHQDTPSCPYCPIKVEIEYEMTQLRRHLGYHLQQMALFILPRPAEDELFIGKSEMAYRGDSESESRSEPNSNMDIVAEEPGMKTTYVDGVLKCICDPMIADVEFTTPQA